MLFINDGDLELFDGYDAKNKTLTKKLYNSKEIWIKFKHIVDSNTYSTISLYYITTDGFTNRANIFEENGQKIAGNTNVVNHATELWFHVGINETKKLYVEAYGNKKYIGKWTYSDKTSGLDKLYLDKTSFQYFIVSDEQIGVFDEFASIPITVSGLGEPDSNGVYTLNDTNFSGDISLDKNALKESLKDDKLKGIYFSMAANVNDENVHSMNISDGVNNHVCDLIQGEQAVNTFFDVSNIDKVNQITFNINADAKGA